ncbi:MAG: TA system VapC family ribonuclease toxin [Terracidiphilus sp.]
MIRRALLDVNVLVALTSIEHPQYRNAQRWFDSLADQEWGICPLTEAGYVRVVTNPASGPIIRTFFQAAAILHDLARRPGCRYWPISGSWTLLTASFAARITGHQQITDAYLLGLAIKEDGVLVTFDRGIKYMAGPEFSRNVLILESSTP